MSNYDAKGPLVLNRQLKVQRLVIPFTVTGNATSTSVLLASDEPSMLFLRSQGVDQITTTSGALDSGETATFTTPANDANGILNMLVKVDTEVVSKVCHAFVLLRDTGVLQPTALGSATGLSSLGKIMVTMDSTVNFSSANANCSLVVEYIV